VVFNTILAMNCDSFSIHHLQVYVANGRTLCSLSDKKNEKSRLAGVYFDLSWIGRLVVDLLLGGMGLIPGHCV